MERIKQYSLPVLLTTGLLLVGVLWWYAGQPTEVEKFGIASTTSYQLANRTVDLSWTDSSEGEDLAIYSDKKDYNDGLTGADVYFAVEGLSSTTADVSFMFNKSENVVSIQEHDLVNKVRYEPIMATTTPSYDCYDEIEEATTTCWTWIQTGTSTIHYQEDEWTEVIEDKQFGAKKDLKSKEYKPQKALKKQGERKQTFRVDMPKMKQKKASLEADYRKAIKEKKLEKKFGAEDDLTLFKARVEYGFEPLKQKEGQFYIEIVTEDGRYAHLDPWYDSNWTYRQKITIDNTKVSADLTDFPVYLDLSQLSSGFFTHVKSGGGDIRITKADGSTEVPREVVSCDTSGDTGEVHFKADGTLSSSSDTEFYIYYGNASASDYATDATYGAENVWTDYEMVYHDGGGTDSTANSANLTMSSVTAGNITGQVGSATDYNAADPDAGSRTDSAYRITGALSISMWLKPESIYYGSTPDWFVHNYDTQGGYIVRGMMSSGDFNLIIRDGSGNQGNFSGSGYLSVDTWGYYVATSNGGTQKLYKNNDTPDSNNSGYNVGARSTSDRLVVATYDTSIQPYDGVIDEIRIANIELSSDWISTEYNNQNSPSTFYTVGSEEEEGGTGTTTEEVIERQSEFWF